MKTITINELRANTEQILEDIIAFNEKDDAVRVTSKSGDVVITTVAEWNILVEALNRCINHK